MSYDRRWDLLDYTASIQETDEVLAIRRGRTRADDKLVRVGAGIVNDTPMPGVINLRPDNMKKWRKALAIVRAGEGNAIIACPGDSTTAGQGAGTAGGLNGAREKAWPAVLARLLNSYHVPTQTGNAWGAASLDATSYPLYDPRVTIGAGWVSTGTSPSSGGNIWGNSTTTNAYSLTPPDAFDTIDVWTLRFPGHGTWTVDVDGGAALATVNANGAGLVVKTTVTVTKGTHTVNFKRSSGGAVWLIGIRTYDSTTSKVEVFNLGLPGTQASNLGSAASLWAPSSQLANIAPDLTIINVGINDWHNNVSPSSFRTSYQTIIDKARLSGDAILFNPIPSDLARNTAVQQAAITDVIKSLSLDNDIPLIDIPVRWTDYATSNGLGFYADTVHGAPIGYADIAQIATKALMV